MHYVYAWCAWAESLGYNPEVTRNLLEVNKKWIDEPKLILDNEIPQEYEGEDKTVQQEIVGFALKDLKGVTNGKTS